MEKAISDQKPIRLDFEAALPFQVLTYCWTGKTEPGVKLRLNRRLGLPTVNNLRSMKINSKRKSHSAEFKARIAMEALRGVRTVSEIAAENRVHPVQVSQWKKELTESAPLLFEKESNLKRRDQEELRQRAKLERKIGQLTVEVDWLREKSKQLGL